MFDWCIKHGVQVTVFTLLICVLGIAAALRIPVQMIPDLEVRTISIVTQWPGSTPRTRIAFQPDLPGVQSMVSFDGPWGFFRLLDQARRLQGGTGDRFQAVFSSGPRSAIFEIRAGSVSNPFNLPELRAFRCPGDL